MATYNFRDVITGDTFNGVVFNIFDKDNQPIDLTGSEVCIQYRLKGKTGVLSLKQSSNDVLVISGNSIEIPEFIVELKPGIYYYDVQINFTDGKVKTWIEGTWEILQDVTKC